VTAIPLFDEPARQKVPIGEHARSRTTDPSTSRAAAERTTQGAKELEDAIVRFVRAAGPVTRFQVADALCATSTRWRNDSVRTAVSRAEKARRIFEYDRAGLSPSGGACMRYSTQVERVETSVL